MPHPMPHQETPVQNILDAIQSGNATTEDFASLELPESYRAAFVKKEEVDMFEGLTAKEKDPRKSLHVEDVPLPELGPGEAFVAVMASAINYNTVWTSIFEPVSTFGFLERYGRNSELTKRHDLPYHVVGSDLAGVVLKTGPGVTKWKPGDRVVAHCLSVELEGPDGHNDTMLDTEQRIWGFETNFGGFATQYALNGGATPVCVVSNEEKAKIARSMGAELIINRSEEGYKFWNDEGTQQDPREWKRFGARIRELTGGEDIDIVFEHPGRETFGASVFVTRKGGTITTCASTTGYMHEYDNRYLWMNLKRIISSHFANYR